MYPNHGQEDTRSAQGNLSWWNTAGVLREVQNLDEYI